MTAGFPHAATAQTAVAEGAIVRKLGTIRSIKDSVLQLNADSGEEVAIEVQATTRIVRVPPGEKNLKNAVPASVSELQDGDRILVGGRVTNQTGRLLASSIVVMKLADVKTLQQQSQQDWQKRGIGGVAKSMDAATGLITISLSAPGSTLKVQTSKRTVFRRYATDSVKYEDAAPGTLQQIQLGDQLRVRGDRSSDGREMAAEEIVSGTFLNLAGIITSVDTSAGTLNFRDLQSKKAFVIRTMADTRLLQLPAPMAERIALRLKSETAGSPSGSAPGADRGLTPVAGSPGGAPDFQQMLGHLPPLKLSDLHTGDAVMVLTTLGTAERVTAVMLLSGVEPILRASPNSGQAMNLGSWSLGNGGGEGSAP